MPHINELQPTNLKIILKLTSVLLVTTANGQLNPQANPLNLLLKHPRPGPTNLKETNPVHNQDPHRDHQEDPPLGALINEIFHLVVG
jgi:hypothetical protein